MKLNTPSVRMIGAIPPLHLVPSLCVQGHLYFFISHTVQRNFISSQLTSAEQQPACFRYVWLMGNIIYNKRLWRHKSYFRGFTISVASGIDCLHVDSSSTTTVFYLTMLSICQAVCHRTVASWWRMNSKGKSGVQVEMIRCGANLLCSTVAH
jgi:hypothetical protein